MLAGALVGWHLLAAGGGRQLFHRYACFTLVGITMVCLGLASLDGLWVIPLVIAGAIGHLLWQGTKTHESRSAVPLRQPFGMAVLIFSASGALLLAADNQANRTDALLDRLQGASVAPAEIVILNDHDDPTDFDALTARVQFAGQVSSGQLRELVSVDHGHNSPRYVIAEPDDADEFVDGLTPAYKVCDVVRGGFETYYLLERL